MVKVRVPATCANLGPGFDTLGLAINIYNTIYVEEISSGIVIEGCDEKYKNENNLVYTSMERVFKLLDYKPTGIKISIKSNIKESSGIGSSSSCIVGGVFCANEIAGNKLTKDELMDLAVKIEGHPDNVIPAIYGGLTISMMDDGKIYFKKIKVDKRLKFYILTSELKKASTKELRENLPKDIPLKDGVFNLSHALMLVEGLRDGDFDLIKASSKDRFHQHFRKANIKDYNEVYEKAMECGAVSLVISGAGPTLLSIFSDDNIDEFKVYLKGLKNSWEITSCEVDDFGVYLENNI